MEARYESEDGKVQKIGGVWRVKGQLAWRSGLKVSTQGEASIPHSMIPECQKTWEAE